MDPDRATRLTFVPPKRRLPETMFPGFPDEAGPNDDHVDDVDADATPSTTASRTVPPAAVLGAVLTSLRDLAHQLRTTPSATLEDALQGIASVLAVARELGGDDDARGAESRRGTVQRVAARYARFVMRGVPAEEAIATCSDECTVTAWDVVRVLRARGVDAHRVDLVGHGDTAFDASFAAYDRHGEQVARGVVVLRARVNDGVLVAHAEVELLESDVIPF
jgi:hypothetical protein